MNRQVSLFIILSALLLTNCNKDGPVNVEPQETPRYLLRSADFKAFNASATYEYNPDSSIRKISVSNGTTGYYTNFSYQNSKISRVAVSGSLYETNFDYSDGRIIRELNTLSHQPSRGQKFEYYYNNNGTVRELRYFNMNEAGDMLQYTSLYEYDQAGRPAKITSTSGNTKITWTIEGYSQAADFPAWAFISPSLEELYELYNYPVLGKLDRLPRKITQTVQLNQGTPQLEKILETNFQVSDRKLIKSTATVTYPNNPQFNNTSEVNYYY